MKIHTRYVGVRERGALEHEVNRQIVKLNRQLKKFDPDLIDLKVNVTRRVQPTTAFKAKVTLSLPPRQLHASAEAGRPVTALKRSCAELIRELRTLRPKLRGEDKRRQVRRALQRRRALA